MKILILNIVCLFLNVLLQAKINFTSSKSNFTLGSGSKLILRKPINNFSGVLKIPNMQSGLIVQADDESKLNFSANSTMLVNGNQMNLVGDLDFSRFGEGEIILDGDKSLFVNSGEFNQKILVSGKNNLISGFPTFNQNIILADENAELKLALGGKLTSDIVLNGGTIKMLGDLYLKDDVLIIGPGKVDVNNYSLVFPNYQTRSMQGDLVFVNGNAIVVNSRTVLTSAWNFTGTTNNLQGTGVLVIMDTGGAINIDSGTTLYCNGIHLKGLGNPGTISFGDAASSFYLTTTILELASDFTQTQGQVIVEGSGCKIIAPAEQNYIVSGSSTLFKVDGQVLCYENPKQLPRYPISTASGGTVSLINGGLIVSNFPVGASFGSIELTLAAGSGSNTFNSNIYLTTSDKITFVNETPGSSKLMIFDGLNNVIDLGKSNNQSLILQENVQLLMQNVTIKNFDISKISFLGSGATLATLTFGDGVVLSFNDNATLSSALNFVGNATIEGNQQFLTISSQKIKLSGNYKTLVIKNAGLKLNDYDSIKLFSSLAKIKIENSELFLTNTGYTFDTGILEFKNKVKFNSCNETVVDGSVQFSLTTTGSATVLSNSEVVFGEDVVFLYDPNVSLDGGDSSVEKRHFKTTDLSSTIKLKNATINAGSSGMALDYGKLLIEESSTLITSLAAGKEFELGSAVKTKIFSGKVFDVNGNIKYLSTTYP